MKRAARILGASVALLVVTVAVSLAEPQAPAERPAPAGAPMEVQWLEQVASFASRTGPFGVIAGLLYGMRVLWQEVKAVNKIAEAKQGLLEAENKALRETIGAIQQKRLDEGVDNARRITEVATTSSQLLADNLRNSVEWTALLRAMKERNDNLVPIFEAMTKKLDRNYRKISHNETEEDAA